ncbi:MAG: mechanosensitive ion channel family protein [Polyangiaceae bacterium]|nr:mechanosensitive ion channel family protein [Polyangiaceae bacterium]MCB9609077.1 mechanosensitive ion channel family protein [Polyangiaceae bacterium]
MTQTTSRVLLALLAAFLLFAFVRPVWADDSEKAQAAREIAVDKCKTPRLAVESVFAPEQADQVRCLGGGRAYALQVELVERIRAVFSGRATIDLDALPTDPDASSPVVVSPRFPKVQVARQPDGRWVWTATSLENLEEIYRQNMAGPWVSQLPDWMKAGVGDLKVWQILALLLVLVVGLVVRKLIEFMVQNRVRQLVDRMGQKWASNLIGVFASPGATFVSALLLGVTYPWLSLPLWFGAFLGLAVQVLMIFSVVWAAYRLVDVLSERMAAKAEATDTKLDDQLVPLIRKSLKVFTVIAGVLVILQNLNVNVGALLATLGVGGVAIALAAKDTVANFFGSLMIFIDRPFQIGDWIRVDGAEGTVEEVGFRSTRIRTFYNSVITVPNAKFTEAKIDNMGMREYRRCFFTLGITYDTSPEQMQAFVEGIRAIIQANEYTRKDTYEVHMSAFGASSLDVMVYFFFRVDTWTAELRERHNVYLEIMRLAHDLDLSFAFPTQSLHLEYVSAPGAPRALPEARSSEQLAEVIHAFGPDGARARPAGPRLTDGYLAVADPSFRSRGATDEG